jgi:hypothetical protein
LQPAALSRTARFSMSFWVAGVVRVAGVAAHRDAGELAHEVVLEPGAGDLDRVVEVLGADEPDHGVDLVGVVALGEAVVAGLHDQLVGVVVRVGGQRGALPGLEVHVVGTGGVAVLRLAMVVGLVEEVDVDPEATLAFCEPARLWNISPSGRRASARPSGS